MSKWNKCNTSNNSKILKNKVLLDEAGKDFVDALFSFLTLPLGTIARLVAEESSVEAVKFGSFSSIYQSEKDLD